MTMLQHAEGLRQICMIKRDLQKVVGQSYHKSYDKVMTKRMTPH